MEYEKINLNPPVEKVSSCGCTEKKKDCGCKKIDIKPKCGTPEYFLVNNYFSELIHEWEKEAARYNLGVQELESIEYKTEETEEGAILTKVVFTYRKGHELITREFCCAPLGPKGEDGKDGETGPLGIQGPKGNDGVSPVLGKVYVSWITENQSDILEGGEFKRYCDTDVWDLYLTLKKPDSIAELERILNEINQNLLEHYVTKDSLTATLNAYLKIQDFDSYDAQYSLSYENGYLYILKNNVKVGQGIRILADNSSFNGTIFRYRITNSATNRPSINTSNPQSSNYYNGPNWTKEIPDIENEGSEFIWMATCNVINDTFSDWSMIRLTGLNGKDGEDGNDIEYIYGRSATNSIELPVLEDRTAVKPSARNHSLWFDHPNGVTEEIPFEFMSFSTRNVDGTWDNFSQPVIWSHYGKNGHDGDGVEYIYSLNNDRNHAPSINTSGSLSGKTFLDDEYVPLGWYDNPLAVTSELKVQWVSTRKKKDGQWKPFSDPKIWNEYQEIISADPNLSIYFNPAFTPYPENGSKEYEIEVFAYLGMDRINMTYVTNMDGASYMSSNNKFRYIADASSNTDFKVYVNIDDVEQYRVVSLVKQALNSGGVGPRGDFKSTAFTRTNKTLTTAPTGGTYDNPIPNSQIVDGETITWSDGIPEGDETVWQTFRTFKGDNTETSWSVPVKLTDTETIDREYTDYAGTPMSPNDYNRWPVSRNSNTRGGSTSVETGESSTLDPENMETGTEEHYTDTNYYWYDPARGLPSGKSWSDMIWEAQRTVENGEPGEWVIFRIKGEKGEKGDPGSLTDTYLISINPSIILVDPDDHSNRILLATVYKNGQSLNSSDYTLEWELQNAPSDVTINGNNTSCSITNPHLLTNQSKIKCLLKVNNQLCLIAYIPVLRNAQNIISPYVIRDKGTWDENQTYVNETLGTVTGNVKYIDVVRYGVGNDYGNYYMPIEESVQGVVPTNTSSWIRAYSLDFAYIHTLIADVISAKSVLAREVLIVNNDSEIVAGMTSGNRLSNNDPDVRIWAGSTEIVQEDEDGNITNTGIDLTLAPFKVYEDGSMVANNATITGTFNLSNMYIDEDVTLPLKDSKGVMRWLLITDSSNSYSVSVSSGSDAKIKYNGNLYNVLNYKDVGLYFIVKTEEKVNGVGNDIYIVYKFNLAEIGNEAVMFDGVGYSSVSIDDSASLLFEGSLLHIILDHSEPSSYTYVGPQEYLNQDHSINTTALSLDGYSIASSDLDPSEYLEVPLTITLKLTTLHNSTETFEDIPVQYDIFNKTITIDLSNSGSPETPSMLSWLQNNLSTAYTEIYMSLIVNGDELPLTQTFSAKMNGDDLLINSSFMWNYNNLLTSNIIPETAEYTSKKIYIKGRAIQLSIDGNYYDNGGLAVLSSNGLLLNLTNQPVVLEEDVNNTTYYHVIGPKVIESKGLFSSTSITAAMEDYRQHLETPEPLIDEPANP